MSAEHPLEMVADVLEKSANYIDALEEERNTLQTEKTQQRDAVLQKEAEELAQKYERATGEAIDVDVLKKIAGSEDDEIKQLFDKLASFEDADELGRPHEKNASGTGDIPPADARFLNWTLS